MKQPYYIYFPQTNTASTESDDTKTKEEIQNDVKTNIKQEPLESIIDEKTKIDITEDDRECKVKEEHKSECDGEEGDSKPEKCDRNSENESDCVKESSVNDTSTHSQSEENGKC